MKKSQRYHLVFNLHTMQVSSLTLHSFCTSSLSVLCLQKLPQVPLPKFTSMSQQHKFIFCSCISILCIVINTLKLKDLELNVLLSVPLLTPSPLKDFPNPFLSVLSYYFPNFPTFLPARCEHHFGDCYYQIQCQMVVV
jgi:hypothetical protein